VGDCYVAVAGLPDPRKDHAVVMARFARDCVSEHLILTKKLEVKLGPDTGDLRLRISLHSGPITAGVLLGKRSRFQLFGDTVNTCARMERAGDGNQIHTSEETAKLLMAAGKGNWVREREDLVHLKGKGAMKTFWLSTKNRSQDTNPNSSSPRNSQHFREGTLTDLDSKTTRLVDWNVESLIRVIKQIVARRSLCRKRRTSSRTDSLNLKWKETGTNPLDEVVEIIHLPELHPDAKEGDSDKIELDPGVVQLVKDYVVTLASMYRGNPFHNFEVSVVVDNYDQTTTF
jgi:hypothetical protein